MEYIIYLSKKLGEEESEVSKTLTISHECKRIIQHFEVENSLLKDSILKKYFKLKCQHSDEACRLMLSTNMFYRNFCSEYDAFRESRRMASKICGQERVERLLDEKINAHRNRLVYMRCDSSGLISEILDLTYWEHIKAINTNVTFDFRKEFEKTWSIYREVIRTDVNEIRKKCQEEWSEPEAELVRAYDLLIKYKGP